MKHLKKNCQVHHLIIADCGLACANCGVCKCGKVHHEEEKEEEEKKRLENKSQSNRNKLSKKQKKKFKKSANGALKSLNYIASAS